MSQLHFYRFYLEFGCLRKAFRHKFRLPPPSSDFLADVVGLQTEQRAGDLPKTMEGPLPSNAKAAINLQDDPIIQKYGSKKVGLTRCLLTKEEMRTFHFPLQGFPDCENFLLTKCNGSIADNSPLFGLDCEMARTTFNFSIGVLQAECLTSKGRELTRISLVAEGGCCVMDELVKPENKILDYLTSFSGITKKILNPVTTKLKDVQRQLKALLPPDAVLVGHSLDLDLRALKMIHPYVIDTSLLYVREQGRRFKLKFLAKVILGKDIQCPDRLGHDATEDARTILELARYFLKHGPKKIAELNLEALANHQEIQAAGQEPKNTAEVLQHPNTSVLECLDSVGQKLLFLTRETDAGELPSSRNCQTIKCLSNKEVQRPVTELTLDCDTLVNELEGDSENQGSIYLSGVSETFKEQLLQEPRLFLGLEAVILPKDLKSGKQKKYCFLKFKSFGSAQQALNILTGKDWKLKGRHALTPRHLHAWLRGLPPESTRLPGLRVVPPPFEQEALQTLKLDHPKIAAWRWSRKIGKLYNSLCPGTLCLILLPGTKR
nr:Unknown gene product [Homo sapiens]